LWEPDKINTRVPIADPFLEFMLNFFFSGYLSFYIPIISTAGRAHEDSLTNTKASYLKDLSREYINQLIILRKSIICGRVKFHVLDGQGNKISSLTGKNLLKFNWKVFIYAITKETMFEQKQPWIIRLVRYIYVKIRG
jgi:hypothetical protein